MGGVGWVKGAPPHAHPRQPIAIEHVQGLLNQFMPLRGVELME